MDKATCAKCGNTKELCNAARVDGIMQPRICKDCLLNSMQTGDYETNDLWWILQISELDDKESIAAMKKLADKENEE